MGGYGSLRNGMIYNDVFGHVIAISPALLTKDISDPEFRPRMPGVTRSYLESVFGDLSTVTDRDVDVFWLSKKMKDDGAVFPSLYFACGANDRLIYESRRFHAHLTELGVPHVFEEGPGTHDELFFEPHMLRGFDRLDLDRLPETINPLWVD